MYPLIDFQIYQNHPCSHLDVFKLQINIKRSIEIESRNHIHPGSSILPPSENPLPTGMDPFVSDPTDPVTTSPKTQGQEEEGLGADPSFNSLTTESVVGSPDAEGGAAATQADDEAESGAPGSPSPPRPPPSISEVC